ncbi:hypothetical protein HDU98_011200 [Podochytrium sp. JEL0797]|nr:hypothetical protein HDU98_011200 [Podochytrium sp. JEL0797]
MRLTPAQTDTLDKLCRFLSSVRGTDKVLMLYQYVAKILILKLQQKDKSSLLAARLANLAAPVSDTRVLLRYSGLFSLVQWILFSERNPPPTPFLRVIYRLQNLANLCYYPLEHVYYLAAHKVMLYFLQLHQEHRLLTLRQLHLTQRQRSAAEPKQVLLAEQASIDSERQGLAVNAVINAAYFPMTLHWSVEESVFPEMGVAVCGSVAAVAQVYSAWKSA